MSLRIDTPIQFLKGVGPKLGETLNKKGVQTIGDLLQWYPRAYEDRRAARNISSLKPDELVSLKAQVVAVKSFNLGKSRRRVYDVTLRDGTGKVHCKFFRVPYKGFFERFQPNQLVRVIGKVGFYRGQIEFHHPDIQDFDEDVPEEERDTLLPIYPETEGLSERQIQKLVRLALQELKAAGYDNPDPRPPNGASRPRTQSVPFVGSSGRQVVNKAIENNGFEPLEKVPRWIRDEWQLPDRYLALCNVHQPPKDAGADWTECRSPFHRRLIFEEFFWLELYLAAKRAGLQRESAPAFTIDFTLVDKLKARLPFPLTAAQVRAFEEIVADLRCPHPMHRLVQGDVGCGKTLVALLASLVAVAGGWQAAIMVPTEILAEQHYKNAVKYLEPLGITVGLLTGAMKAAERAQTLDLLRNGMIHFIVGTHALIEEEVEFNKLGLVIIDEQHRFGVHQRNRLKQKAISPHFLVMTATPIPRTLAMTVYGDLDVSVIDEMPPGRSPVITRVTYDGKRQLVMQFVRDQLALGRQCYFVYPSVEESEKVDLKDAISEFENLRKLLPEWKVGLLHGKMKPAEKDDVMARFRAGEIHALVSTTVIEVGVDVPNANLMIIEHAERFGLSQLHQLRGRVGRGTHKSYCVLILGHAVSEESRRRAEIMEKTSDGFKIAEADLEFRGPGEFLGARQSGLAGFKLANLVRDVKILQEARAAAFAVFKRDPSLSQSENIYLREELLRTHGATALASVG